MDFTQITPYLVAANIVLTWGLGFYVHLVNKNKATNDRIDTLVADLQTRLRLQAEAISRMDALINVVPTHDDLGKLYRELNETSQQVSRMAGEMSQMNSNMRLLLTTVTRQRLTD